MAEYIELGAVFSIAFFAAMGHCVGMCGGIVLAYSTLISPKYSHKVSESSPSESSLDSEIPSPLGSKRSFASRFILFAPFATLPYHLTYHAGKVLTYSLLGFIVGVIGAIAAPSPTLKAVILGGVGGLLILIGLGIMGFSLLTPLSSLAPSAIFARFGILLRPLLARHKGDDDKISESRLKLFGRLFVLGLANGLLPCGIVYYFLLSASVSGSGFHGTLVMLTFGVASITPLLLLGLFSSSLLNSQTFQTKRVIFLRLSGVMMIIFGVWEVCKAIASL